jgi:hypothetical protein
VSIHAELATKNSRTFAICFAKYFPSSSNGEDMETHNIHLIDDQTLETISSLVLDAYENGCSIITCSFTNNFNSYYYVKTAYALPKESEQQGLLYILHHFSLLLILLLMYLFMYAHLVCIVHIFLS